MKKIFSTLVLGIFATIGCAQVPAPSPQPTEVLACTLPSNFVAGTGNGVVFARAICPTASTCPTNSSGNTSFTALNASSPATTCAFTDNAPPTGVLVIYTASIVQGGLTGQPSGPSNNGVPSSIPVYPGTPGSLTGTQTAMLAPPVGETTPVLAQTKEPGPSFLTARLVVPNRK